MQLEQLTFTRYVAAIVVAYFHFGATLDSGSAIVNRVLLQGPAMVSYFFVLSGFILTTAYPELPDWERCRSFWAARIARIAPVYFLALSLLVAIRLLTGEPIPTGALLAQASLIQAWLPGTIGTLNFPGWSLSVEAFFYAVFPALIVRSTELSTRSLLTIAAAAWGATWLICEWAGWGATPRTFELLHYNPLFHLNAFIVGIAAAVYYRRSQSTPPKGAGLATLTWLGTAALLVLFFACHDDLARMTGLSLAHDRGLLAPLYAVLIVGLANDRSWIARLLATRPLVVLGQASYAVYILQVPAWHAFIALSGHAIGTWPAFLAYSGFLTLVSVVVLVFFERPLRSHLRRRLSAVPHRQTAPRPT